MANSSSTVVVDSSTTTGYPLPLGYGFVWATGKRAAYYEVQNTGNDDIDFSRVGFWLLAEGEWDGCEELWINDNLIWTSEFDDPTQFHFHRGTDSPLGPSAESLAPTAQPFSFTSIGPDQACDQFWSWFPTAVTPLCFSRIAYYGIFRKQPIENQTNTHQNDPTQWTDIAPVGLWRGLRVRIFDDEGNQTGYAFSRNPVWHWVDFKLRRKLFPEYNIDLVNGIDPIPDAVAARFNWGDIYASAAYCNQVIPTPMGPRPRFCGDYAFNQQTTRTAIEEQILKVCRGYTRTTAGRMSLLIDQPRPSVFTFSRTHILPGSFSPSDKTVSAAPNSYVAKFRDLLVPEAAEIESITCADHQNPVVTFYQPHPFNNGDRVAIGGTDTLYDGEWYVLNGNPEDATEPITLTLQTKGSNYPAGPVGAGAAMGLLYSRFKERAPTFNHQNNQFAKGAVGVGIPRQLNAVPVTYDLAVSTFDQASRIARYEKDTALGLDQSPYVTPPTLTFKCPMYAADEAGSGAVAKQVQPGDWVTLDDTASYAFAGIYEVKKVTHRPFTAKPAGSGNTITLTADPGGGVVDFTLGPCGVFYDTTDPNSAGWSNVPGSDPGNDGDYTGIDLADGGTLAFISGSVASGSAFDLPSSGFSPSNLMVWASPQGYVERGDVMHVISLCDVNTDTRVCTLTYEDGEDDFWPGDVNFAAVTWIGDSTAASTEVDDDGITWLMCTLDGGEQICFGSGVVANGAVVALPAGFTQAQMFALAFPHDATPTEAGASGNQAHGVGAYIDDGMVVHLNYQDGEGHIWHGNARVMIFAWKNNSGLVTTQSVGGATWMIYPSPAGMTLGVGFGNYEDSSSLGLPSVAGAGDSLQTMAGPHNFEIVDHPAHGVGACYVDASLMVHCMFEDGEGNQWTGTADVFALFYEPDGTSSTSAGGIGVSVTPGGAEMALSGTLQFSAQVVGSSNTSVNWSVDGIAGGNSTVGTIDATGNYTAPATNGVHLITATSQANAAAQGWQFVKVGTGTAGSGASAIQVFVTPSNVSVTPGGQQQFSALVTGTATTSVNWSVDGIAGGNATVGTISATGLYTAPTATGYHSVTATSTVSSSSAGSAAVTVGTGGGAGSGSGGGPSAPSGGKGTF